MQWMKILCFSVLMELALTAADQRQLAADSLWTDDRGASIPMDALFSGTDLVIVDFMFTSCQHSCPLATAHLRRLYQALGPRVGSEVKFVSLSIDPEKDTSEALRAYKARFHLGADWGFYRGDLAAVMKLQEELLTKAREKDPQLRWQHGKSFLIGQPKTQTWIVQNLEEAPARLLAAMDAMQYVRTPAKSSSHSSL